MPKLIGGFGSSGAGNRTGRSIYNRTGLSTTPRERNRRITLLKRIDSSNDPTRQELQESIRIGRCWWCGQDKFQSLSQHWIKAHGIKKSVICEILQVPQKTSFVSEELKSVFRTNSETRGLSDRFHTKGRKFSHRNYLSHTITHLKNVAHIRLKESKNLVTLTFRGESLTFAGWAVKTGIPVSTLKGRY